VADLGVGIDDEKREATVHQVVAHGKASLATANYEDIYFVVGGLP
jgi:hypothetical protein